MRGHRSRVVSQAERVIESPYAKGSVASIEVEFARVKIVTGADRSGGFSFPLYLRHNEWQAGLGFLFVLAWLVFSPWR